jgi:hypothetical protein
MICLDLCQSAAGLFLDMVVGLPAWLDARTVAVAFVLSAPPALQHFPFQPPGVSGAGPVARVAVGELGASEILIGDVLSVVFTPPAGVTLGLYSAIGPWPVNVSGANAAGGLFLLQGQGSVTLTMPIEAEGPGSLQVVAVQAMYEKAVVSIPVLETRLFTGVASKLLALDVQVLCSAAILWSAFGAADEPCPVRVVPAWAGGQGPPGDVFTCTSYPCSIQYQDQTLFPVVPTFWPSNALVRVQRGTLAVGERAQWRATVTLDGVGPDVTVNVRALEAGLLTVQPPNALAVGGGSLVGQLVGQATLTFGTSTAAMEVTDQPAGGDSLQGALFTQVAFAVSGGTMTASFIGETLAPGQRGYVLAQASYADGAGVVLSPELDLSVTPLADVTPLRDGSLLASPLASPSLGPVASVAFGALSAQVPGAIQTPAPLGLQACCNATITFRASAMYGLASLGDIFSLSNLSAILEDGQAVALAMGDPRVTERHDPDVLAYANGTWTAAPAPRVGPTVVNLTFTQPGTLTRVGASLTLTIVDAQRLVLQPAYPLGGYGGVLHRLHCSDSFQRISFAAIADAGVLQAPVEAGLALAVSNETVLVPAGPQALAGAAVGRAIVTVTWRGLRAVQAVLVSDQSDLVTSLSAPAYRLSGALGEAFPCLLEGTLRSGAVVRGLEAFVPVSADLPPELGLTNGTLILLGSSPPLAGSVVRFALASCGGYTPTAEAQVLVTERAPPGQQDLEVDVSADGLRLDLTLLSAGAAGFYAEVHADTGITGCALAALPGISACSVSPDATRALFAGALSGAYGQRAPLGYVTLLEPPLWLTGFLETADEATYGLRRGPVVAGRRGSPPPLPGPGLLPVVDAGSLARQYAGLLPGAAAGLPALLDSLLLLVGKTHLVDPRLYSNDFELSAMFRVVDRFLQPVDGASGANVTVLFRTDQLPAIPGSVQTKEGLLASADFVQDGWYVAEWRQQIPQLNVSVAYTLRVSDGWEGGTTWELPAPLETGAPLAQCPRGGYATGSLLARFVADGNGTLAPSQDVLRRMACTMRVAARRILVSQDSQGRLSLAVAVESFNRLSETNFAVMNDWFADTFLPLLNFTAWRIDRDGVAFINDTADPRRPCAPGLYQDPTGAMVPLPMHADPGVDCVDFACQEGYQRADLACVPASLPADLMWTVVVLVLGLVAAGMILLCVLQLACRPGPAEEVRFDPGEEPAPPETEKEPDEDDEMTEVDLDAVGRVWLDDYSRSMIEGEFSPRGP